MRDEFEQDGIVIIPECFSEQEIAVISAEVDRVIEGEAAYLPEGHRL